MRLILFLLISLSLFCEEFPFKARLKNANPGDYLVLSGAKMITLISIHTKTDSSLILEEISIPSEKIKKIPENWKDWVEKRAPGHSSWSMIEFNPSSGEILECYSFSKSAWIRMNQEESLFATLFNLPFEKVSLQERKKIGPLPLEGELDYRKIWQPPALFEGKKESFHFDAFQTKWPSDNSELSNKEILLYFDQELGFALPFWIELKASFAGLHFKTLAAGRNLHSPQKKMPRRAPQWIGGVQKKEDGSIVLKMNIPKYYKNFELYAVDTNPTVKELFPIEEMILESKEEIVTIEIPKKTLEESLKPDHEYQWLLIPNGSIEAHTQSKHSFTWKED